MTNQEWLQQNNAKIEEIKETLAKKVIMIQTGTNTIEIELPQEFYNSHSLNYYSVNKDTVLISTSSSIGLWVYHVKAKTIEKKWSNGSSWQNFYQITDDLVLITSSTSPNSTLVYDAETDTISPTGMNFAGTIYIQQVSDGKFLISGSSASPVGVYLFNVGVKSCSKIYDAGAGFRYFSKVGESWIMCSALSVSLGVFKYDIQTETVEKIYTNSNAWTIQTVIDNECFLSSTGNSTGILKYNDNDKTIKQLTTYGREWKYIVKAGGKIFASISSSLYAGLYLIENDEVVKIYETGYGYQYFHAINDRVIINNSSKTALIYDSKDGSVSSLSAPISYMKYGIALKDRLLLLSDSTSYTPLAVYYYETNEIKQHPTLMQFAYYDTLKKDGDNCYISSSKSGYGMIAYYTYADDSIKLMGAKLEVKL